MATTIALDVNELVDSVIKLFDAKSYDMLSGLAVASNLVLAERMYKVIEVLGGKFDWYAARKEVDKAYKTKTPESVKTSEMATVYYELMLSHTSDFFADHEEGYEDWDGELAWAKLYGVNSDLLHRLYQRALQHGPLECYRWDDATNTLVDVNDDA